MSLSSSIYPNLAPVRTSLAKSSLLVTCQPKEAMPTLARCQKIAVLYNLVCFQTFMFCFPFTWRNVSSYTAKIILAILGEQYTIQDYF